MLEGLKGKAGATAEAGIVVDIVMTRRGRQAERHKHEAMSG